MDSFHNLRQRVPFTIQDDQDENPDRILDDQEQEELIRHLRSRNHDSNKAYLLGADTIISLSFLLQLTYLFSSSHTTPLFRLVPSSSARTPTSPPLTAFFTLINLLIHLNLLGLLHPERVRSLLDETHSYSLGLLSYSLCYALTCVAPCLYMFMDSVEWQTMVWWLFTPAIIYIAQSIHAATTGGDQYIAELEAMRYSAPGA